MDIPPLMKMGSICGALPVYSRCAENYHISNPGRNDLFIKMEDVNGERFDRSSDSVSCDDFD
jgi:hypothetical protein